LRSDLLVRLALATFEVADPVADVIAEGIESFQLEGFESGSGEQLVAYAIQLIANLLLSARQCLALCENLLQFQLFEIELFGAPAAHAIE